LNIRPLIARVEGFSGLKAALRKRIWLGRTWRLRAIDNKKARDSHRGLSWHIAESWRPLWTRTAPRRSQQTTRIIAPQRVMALKRGGFEPSTTKKACDSHRRLSWHIAESWRPKLDSNQRPPD
jgi:hypothetical protein